jgi:hypothetical protein
VVATHDIQRDFHASRASVFKMVNGSLKRG